MPRPARAALLASLLEADLLALQRKQDEVELGAVDLRMHEMAHSR